MKQEELEMTERLLKEEQIKQAKKSAARMARKRQVYFARFLVVLGAMAALLLAFILIRSLVRKITGNDKAMETVVEVKVEQVIEEKTKVKKVYDCPDIQEAFLTPNEYSRPGEALPIVRNIFVHYTANAGTDAMQNRSYFEGLSISGETSASAHFVIGYEGEIVQCIPLDEIAYAVKQRNYDSISIECCYTNQDGSFTSATYESLLHLTTYLMGKYDLHPEDVLRHYDEGGKNCPKYYVEHEKAWDNFHKDLADYIDMYGSYDEPMQLPEQT